MLQYTINNIAITDTLITTTFNRDETIEYDNGKIITSQVDFELDRSYATIFSNFWYKWRVTVYDTDAKKYLWDGRLVNIEFDDSKPTIKLITVHYLDDTRQVCNLAIENKTPSEIVYQLLTDTTYGAGIPSDYIVAGGFETAKVIQTAAGVLMSITYDEDSETEIKSIIEEICRIASCKLYVRGNYIYFEQMQNYSGQLGYQVKYNNIIANSYSHEFTDENIYNKYYIAYNASGEIAFASGSDTASITTYGKKIFGVPEGTDLEAEDPDEDCYILLQSSAAATWCGNLALTLNKNLRQKGKIKTPLHMDYIGLGDQIDLYFGDFVNEPCKVTSKKFDYKAGVIEFEFDFLNIPVEIVERDTTPPDPPALHSVEVIDNGLRVKFTQNQEADYIGNKIYFTASNNYYGEYSAKGLSPVDSKTTELIDGLLQVDILRLSPGISYKIYVTAYDSDRNESDPSNVVEASTTGEPATIDTYDPTYIPDSAYTEYLVEREYLPWYLERDYTQTIAVAGPQGEQGIQGIQGEKGDPGDVTGPESSTDGNIALFDGVGGNVIQDSGYALSDLLPPGTVLPYAGSSTPSKFLSCNGAAVSRTTYAALFSAIGTTWGSGDGSTTFNVPDGRGVFIKGAGTTDRVAGVDASGNYYAGTLGAYLQDEMQGFKIQYNQDNNDGSNANSNAVRCGSSNNGVQDASSIITDGTNGTPRTGHTTEPQSLGLNFIIKY